MFKGLGTAFLFKRFLVELRGIRVALERQADALELAAGVRSQKGTQTFRGYSHGPTLDDQQLRAATEVTYVDDAELGRLLAKEDELRSLLGKDPTPEQVIAAVEGVEP